MLRHISATWSSTALALVLAAGAATVHADDSTHYSWLNERGEPVYSDRPPPKGVDYQVVSSTSSFRRQVPAEEGPVPPETEPRPGNEFDPTDDTAGGRIEKNPVLCENARKDLEALTGKAMIVVRDNEGNKRKLTPDEIMVHTATARAKIDIYCED